MNILIKVGAQPFLVEDEGGQRNQHPLQSPTNKVCTHGSSMHQKKVSSFQLLLLKIVHCLICVGDIGNFHAIMMENLTMSMLN